MEQVRLHCFNELLNSGFGQGFRFPRAELKLDLRLRGFFGDREGNTDNRVWAFSSELARKEEKT